MGNANASRMGLLQRFHVVRFFGIGVGNLFFLPSFRIESKLSQNRSPDFNPKWHLFSILDLPESVLFHLLSFLDVIDLCNLSLVNKKWNRIANDQLALTFPIGGLTLFIRTDYPPDFDWKSYYKSWTISFRQASNPLMYCCQNGITQKYLCESLQENNSTEPMYHAILYGQKDVVKRLIEMGHDPTSYMFLACKSQSQEVVQVLLDHGVNANCVSNPFEIPIHYLAGSKDTSMMKLLLENKANVNMEDYHSKMPLQIAVQSNNIEMVNLLLDYGANPNIPVEYAGDMPLEGFPGPDPDIIDALVSHGAPLNRDKFYWFGINLS